MLVRGRENWLIKADEKDSWTIVGKDLDMENIELAVANSVKGGGVFQTRADYAS